MSAFEKHRAELEVHETMMGSTRGRLAVALDLLTDALAMVGQHGVYCQSARRPGQPAMDVALILEQIGDAKGFGGGGNLDGEDQIVDNAQNHRCDITVRRPGPALWTRQTGEEK